eukprot:jgi/Mesvir1/646/Mv17258-RA.1
MDSPVVTPETLERYKVGHSLPTIYYVPNYISGNEEAELLQQVYAQPRKWTEVRGRRLQNWGGIVHEKGMLPQPLPKWMLPLLARISHETRLFGDIPFNHCLINEYKPGDGIMPHQDGPLYWPVVAIVSLQAPTVIQFTPHPSRTQAASEGTKVRGQVVPEAQPCSDREGDVEPGGCDAGASCQHPSDASTETDTLPADTQTRARDDSTDGPCGGGDIKPVPGVAKGSEGDGSAVASTTLPPRARLLLEPRSLLLFKDAAYTDCLHGIDGVKEDSIDDSVVNLEHCTLWPQWQTMTAGQSVSLGSAAAADPPVKEMRVTRSGTRVSFTCRVVLRVRQNILRL